VVTGSVLALTSELGEHLGATGVEPKCLRPHSAGSTLLRLWPTGSSVGMAPVDYDPVVLLKPFGPRLAAGALPSRESSMVAAGRPIRFPAFAVVPH
jgi:hypothetical protein